MEDRKEEDRRIYRREIELSTKEDALAREAERYEILEQDKSHISANNPTENFSLKDCRRSGTVTGNSKAI